MCPVKSSILWRCKMLAPVVRFTARRPQGSATKLFRIVLCFLPLAAIQAEPMIDGSAIVTSRSGSVSAQQADGQAVATDLHSVLRPAGVRWSTQDESRLFLALSNGVALGLDENTTLHCTQYGQRPYTADGLEEGREPSVSKSLLQLEAGRIAVASDQLSPLSELRIALPFGSVLLHRGTCLIEYDSTGIRLTAFEGNLTYSYPDSNAREYVPASRQVRISQQSAKLQRVAETTTAATLGPEAVLLCRAAQHSSQRVVFLPNRSSGEAPEAVLIAPPGYLEQAPLRPYTFKD